MSRRQTEYDRIYPFAVTKNALGNRALRSIESFCLALDALGSGHSHDAGEKIW